MPKKAVRTIDTELDELRAKVDALSEKWAAVDDQIKPLERQRAAFASDAAALDEAIGEALIRKWGNTPDWQHILRPGSEGGRTIQAYGDKLLGQFGLSRGLTWSDTNESIIAIALNRHDPDQLRLIEMSLLHLSQFMHRRRGNVVWFKIQHRDPGACEWTLVYNVIHGVTTLEQHIRCRVAERLRFQTLHKALLYAQKHLWAEDEISAEPDADVVDVSAVEMKPKDRFKVEMTEAGSQLVMFS